MIKPSPDTVQVYPVPGKDLYADTYQADYAAYAGNIRISQFLGPTTAGMLFSSSTIRIRNSDQPESATDHLGISYVSAHGLYPFAFGRVATINTMAFNVTAILDAYDVDAELWVSSPDMPSS